MTKQVAYKVLSEFWCWYGDVVNPLSTFTDDEHELTALDEVGEHSFDGLPLPSHDAKFFICGKEFEVRDALSLATMTIEQVVNEFPDNPDVPSVRVKSELLLLLFSRFWRFLRMITKRRGSYDFLVTPSFSVIRTKGLEPSRLSSLEPENGLPNDYQRVTFSLTKNSLPSHCFLIDCWQPLPLRKEGVMIRAYLLIRTK